MKIPLRSLICALAAASALAAAPAGANPAPQRVTGGPGASALLKNGTLTMHWPGGGARIPIPPDYHLPAVTTRGERGGISFDGRTVVLAYGGPSQGDGRSRFLIAENGRLTPLTFRGRVSFDAVAPGGKSVYVIRHTSAADATLYEVLLYDRTERTTNPVGVKVEFSAEGAEEPDGWSMQGLPLARATAPNGRWVYTLYDSREYPFIHALPLGQGAWAACIELPEAWRERAGTLSLRAQAGRKVDVLNAKGAVVAIADLVRNTLQLVKNPS
jgi:hypothetical protein